MDDVVRVRHRASKKLYPAKILEYQSAEDRAAKYKTEGKKWEARYFVHYRGWKSK